MNELDRRLAAWVDADIISSEQATAIAVHERGSQPAGSRTTAAEAIGYVGAALAIGALFLLFGEIWSDLLIGGRIALVATLTAALLIAGLVVRRAATAAMGRLASVLLTGSVATFAWLAGIIAKDVLDLRSAVVGVVVSATALVVAVVLYVTRQGALLQLAVLASLIALLVSTSMLPQLPVDLPWQGGLVAAIGAAWMLLARGGWHQPRLLADFTGAALILIGGQIAAAQTIRIAALSLTVLAAAAFVTAAVRFDAFHLLVVGAIGLFAVVPQLVFEIFGDVIGAPATLLLVGLLLVLLAVGLGRARREVSSRRRFGAKRKSAKEVATDE